MAGEPVRRISPTEFRVARRGTSREINRQIALNLIRSKQPISRAELARLMGVRRGAVSRLVDELLDRRARLRGRKGREHARAQADAPPHRDAPPLRGGGRREREPHRRPADRPARPPAPRRERVPDPPPPRAARPGRGGGPLPPARGPPGGRRVRRRRGRGLGAGERRRAGRVLPHPGLARRGPRRAAAGRPRCCRSWSRTRPRPACSGRCGRCAATPRWTARSRS